MNTVGLEFVPPSREAGEAKAFEEAQKADELSREFGFDGRLGHLIIPGMIDEDPDRPVPLKPRMDTMETWQAARPAVPSMKGICTQVTAFTQKEELTTRFEKMRDAGMEGIIFVGVPRTLADGEGSGVAPTDALAYFKDLVPNRGVILIPTRDSEDGRFNFKCERGATFAMTQLLYSDAIVGFLESFAAAHPHRPEILLSFGFVPKAESRVGLIRWLIKDPGNPAVDKEQAFVEELTTLSFKRKKAALLDLYKRVIDGLGGLDFPLSLHLEAPYGFTRPAFETFGEMLSYWAPDKG